MQLVKHGVEHYLPIIQQVRQWSDRKKVLEVPLFNGYLFVKPTGPERDMVLTLTGVVKYLRYNGKDGYVSDREIEIIQSLISRGYDISEYNEAENFEPGDKVMITSGPMKNFEGEILSQKGERFAFMVLENFGHTVKIKLPKQVLKKIDK